MICCTPSIPLPRTGGSAAAAAAAAYPRSCCSSTAWRCMVVRGCAARRGGRRRVIAPCAPTPTARAKGSCQGTCPALDIPSAVSACPGVGGPGKGARAAAARAAADACGAPMTARVKMQPPCFVLARSDCGSPPERHEGQWRPQGSGRRAGGGQGCGGAGGGDRGGGLPRRHPRRRPPKAARWVGRSRGRRKGGRAVRHAEPTRPSPAAPPRLPAARTRLTKLRAEAQAKSAAAVASKKPEDRSPHAKEVRARAGGRRRRERAPCTHVGQRRCCAAPPSPMTMCVDCTPVL